MNARGGVLWGFLPRGAHAQFSPFRSAFFLFSWLVFFGGASGTRRGAARAGGEAGARERGGRGSGRRTSRTSSVKRVCQLYTSHRGPFFRSLYLCGALAHTRAAGREMGDSAGCAERERERERGGGRDGAREGDVASLFRVFGRANFFFFSFWIAHRKSPFSLVFPYSPFSTILHARELHVQHVTKIGD